MLRMGHQRSHHTSVFSRSRGSRGLSEHQRRNLLATPPRGPISRLPFEQIEKETEEHESAQESPANSADTRSVALARLSDENGIEDHRCFADDSLDQQTTQILISHSRTRGPDSSIAEISQSLIPHSLEYGLGSTDQNPQIGDLVVVYLRHTGKGRKRRQVTKSGIL